MQQLEGEHINEVFTDLVLDATPLRGATFEGCTFQRCRFEKTPLLDCRFSDCRFEQCDLVAVKLTNSSLMNTTFQGGRAMGVDWAGLNKWALGLGFTDVVMDYSNFTRLPLSKTVFKDCRLREAVFSECDLTRASFDGCDLADAVIRHANLTGTDFRNTRGCTFHAASCTVLRTQVDSDTALYLLQAMGVVCPDLGV